MNACITVKLPSGELKNIDIEDIENVSINYCGEKTIFWKDGYGFEVDDHRLSANTFVNNKMQAKEVRNDIV